MTLDVRWPIGALFTIFGIILGVYGLTSDRSIYVRSLGIDVNLWWGAALLVFGLVMLALAHRASGWDGWRRALSPDQPDKDPRPPAV
jgi:hypothetical protein